MKLYLRLIKYIGPYKVRLLLAGLCTLVAAGGTIYLPWIIKDVVDQILAEKDLVKLNYISLSIVLVFIIRGIQL